MYLYILSIHPSLPLSPPPLPSSQISGEGEDEGSLEQAEEYYYDEGIDPLEKEWMMGAVVCNMDLLHRMIMSDSSIVNKKDFVYVATILHICLRPKVNSKYV